MTRAKLIALLYIISSITYSQQSPARFKRISISDGLSLSSVYCVHRDSKGYIWMGTEDGLNRFDGYHYKIYRSNIKDSNSICYKWIEQIFEDTKGYLWFGSRAGLSKYNPQTETFTNFHYTSRKSNSLLNDTITYLSQANDSIVFAGTVNGLNLINFKTNKIDTINLKIGRINSIKPISDEVFAIGTNQGLFYFDIDNMSFTSLLSFHTKKDSTVSSMAIKDEYLWVAGIQNLYKLHAKNKSLLKTSFLNNLHAQEQIETLLVDKKNRIWIGTTFGLYLYDEEKNKATQMIKNKDHSHSLAITPTKPLAIDNDGIIWYGTHGSGLYLVSPNLKVNNILHNPFDNSSISQNSINCIYNDSLTGNVWLGTFGAGVNIYNTSASKFDLIKHNPIDENSLSSDFIWSIYESTDSTLWIGTNDKGISRYIPSTHTFEFFDHRPNIKGTLSHSSVREIFEDSKGTIWVGTDGGGLNRYDKKLNQFSVFKNQPNNTSSLSNNSVRVIFEDSKKQLWVGTRNGLNLFDPKSNSFKRFMHDPNDSSSISHNFIYSTILEDNSGYLWIGTYGGGLNRMNPKNETFVCYSMQGETGKVLSNNIVFSVYEANNGLIWIGTNEGLNVLDRKDGSISYFGTNDGLPNEVIYGILPDHENNLWLSTNYGISCFNTETEKFKNYDVHDGLQSNEFNGGAFHKGNNGKLYFGGVYGLNVIHTTSVLENNKTSQPIITQLEVLGKKVNIDHRYDGHRKLIRPTNDSVILTKNISYTDEINLNYKQRFFSLEFSGLNHLYPNKTRYSYQLYPLEHDWHNAGTRNYVSYANVNPGTYIFSIKSTNIDGVWNQTPTELKITIEPPFWLTYWFIALEILLVLVIIIFFYRYLIKIKTNKILQQQNIQMNAANEKLVESESSLKQINATKDKFFSIISHDLKNPFTGLMSISELLDQNYEHFDMDDRKTSVHKIHKSVKHIYCLLENLLTWSRSQRGTIDFHKTSFNLSSLITENINLYRLSAEKKNVTLQLHARDDHFAYGDRETINTVIRNLTNNAIKYSKPNGSVAVCISNNHETQWKISISDNGVGISEENLKKLFQIDQKLKTEGTAGEKGTGLGLIICKEFTEKNGGTMGIESREEQGSTFWFTIPKTNKD